MIFPSFYPGNLSGTWLGNQFTLDQAITVLRMAVVAKTPTLSTCPAAVFRLTNSTKGQDLVLTPGQNWSDTGAMLMTFNAGDVLQASLRTGSTCSTQNSATGADANLLVEYKMQAAGDTDAPCSGTSCNGFCTTSSSDPSNCGACGTACASGQPCVGGTCNGSSCGSGQTNCNGSCVNEQTDPNNCGTCGIVCNAGTSCVAGVCTTSCPAGQVLCGATCVNTGSDPSNCGACGNVCSINNGTSACVAGLCSVLSCNSGFADCDHNAANGCEVNTNTNTSNCGACGRACSVNNGTPGCQSGSCTILSCTSGFADCDHNAANGCETNTTTDPNNCGFCGVACPSGQSCTAGVCGGGVVGATCSSNAVCLSNACDFVTLKCVSSTCVDQRKDGAETDIDCGGGSCGACGLGLKCQADTDCTSNACDASTLTCVASQCSDHRKDGAETDVDCGGGTCSACALNLHCQADSDCASNACDASSLTCVSNQCSDHRQDGTETDIDCGGPNSCNRCSVAEKCLVNTDCSAGHTCNTSHVCQ